MDSLKHSDTAQSKADNEENLFATPSKQPPQPRQRSSVSLRIARENNFFKEDKIRNVTVNYLRPDLACPQCCPNGPLALTDCASPQLKHHFVNTSMWWTLEFVQDFVLLIHHHLHSLVAGDSKIFILRVHYAKNRADPIQSVVIPKKSIKQSY